MPNNNVCSICGLPSEHLQNGQGGKKYCPECIRQHHLVRCVDDRCGLFMKPEEAYISGQGYLCAQHWNDTYAFCQKCGSIIKKQYSYKIQRNVYICEHCFEKQYFECDDCGEVHDNKDMKEDEINGEIRRLCKTCFECNYAICPICGKLKHRSSISNVPYLTADNTRKEIYGCRECINDVCHSCSNCGRWFENSIQLHEENTCDRCYYSENIIHSYGYKPKIIPQTAAAENADLLFGVENEIELKFNDPERSRYEDCERSFTVRAKTGDIHVDYRRLIAYSIDTAIPGLFYQKHDGSIRFGMEIVSHPATIEYWRSCKDKIEELFSFLRTEGCAGDEASTVGMHIHVSRNKMTRAHQNSFAAFVYSHREKIEKLAGRASNGYTKMITLPNSAEDSEQTKRFEDRVINNHDRYSAVNWNNQHTVELRMFQSTLNTNHFLANIEFSHALYNFSKERTVLECVNGESWKNFIRFITDNGYEYLMNLLIEKSLNQATI